MKRIKILVIALIVLAAVYTIVTLSERRVAGPDPLFREFRAGTAAAIYIDVDGRHAALENQDGVWMVPGEDSLPADPAGIDAILEKVASFSRNDRVSSNPDKRSLLQVDSSGVLVRIVDDEGDTTAAFIVGKVGPDYRSSYVRDTGSGDVILASGYLRSMFDRGDRTWQDRLIFNYKPEDIAMIEVRRGKEHYVLNRGTGGRWYIAAPDSTACKQQSVTGLVRMLAILRCDDFAGRLPVPDSNVAGSDTTLRFATAAGDDHRLLFGSENENGRVHFIREGSDIVYLLARAKVNGLIPPFETVLPEEPSHGGGPGGDAARGKPSPGGGAPGDSQTGGGVPGEAVSGEAAR